MEIPVFISCPKSYLSRQEEFLQKIEVFLKACELRPMTLGRNEYSMDAPLEAIRRLMSGSFGLLALAFRRTAILDGTDRPNSDLNEKQVSRSGSWLSSPYCQIEPAMAYQIGLPILIWRESGVTPEGLLDRGTIGLSMPEFDLDTPPDLDLREWWQPLQDWVDRVRAAHRRSGEAPKLW